MHEVHIANGLDLQNIDKTAPVVEDLDSWDTLYDDSGECKDKKLLKEV